MARFRGCVKLRLIGAPTPVSRVDVALLLLVLLVVLFLFWSRNVVVRVPGLPTPISSEVLDERVSQSWHVRLGHCFG